MSTQILTGAHGASALRVQAQRLTAMSKQFMDGNLDGKVMRNEERLFRERVYGILEELSRQRAREIEIANLVGQFRGLAEMPLINAEKLAKVMEALG